MRARLAVLALTFTLGSLGSPTSALALPLSLAGTTAAGSAFSLEEDRGRVVAITLVSRYTRDDLERVNRALAAQLGADVAMITVVDFMGIPSLLQTYARRRMQADVAGNPIKFLVDDLGRWRRALDASPRDRVDIIVLDRRGELRGHFIGAAEVSQARHLIETLRAID